MDNKYVYKLFLIKYKFLSIRSKHVMLLFTISIVGGIQLDQDQDQIMMITTGGSRIGI